MKSLNVCNVIFMFMLYVPLDKTINTPSFLKYYFYE